MARLFKRRKVRALEDDITTLKRELREIKWRCHYYRVGVITIEDFYKDVSFWCGYSE